VEQRRRRIKEPEAKPHGVLKQLREIPGKLDIGAEPSEAQQLCLSDSRSGSRFVQFSPGGRPVLSAPVSLGVHPSFSALTLLSEEHPASK